MINQMFSQITDRSMFSQMTKDGIISYPLKKDIYSREDLDLLNLFISLPTSFKSDYFLELKKNLKATLKTQQIGKTCLNVHCTYQSVDGPVDRYFNRSLSLCGRCWQHFRRNCCLPTFALKVKRRVDPKKKKDVLPAFPAPPFRKNPKKQKLKNNFQEFKTQPLFSQDLPEHDIESSTLLESSLTPEGQNSSSNVFLNNIFIDKANITTQKLKNNFQEFDPQAYFFSPDLNSNELNFSPLKEYFDPFKAIDSDPVNQLKRGRESVTFNPNEPFDPFEKDTVENLFNLRNDTSDSDSSDLESTIGEVETIKLTCLNPKCKDTSFENFNKEESLCNRCWTFVDKNGEFPKRSSARLRAAAEKTIQKMKATNFDSRGLEPTIGKTESIKLTCLNPNSKRPLLKNFNKEESLCHRCWVFKNENGKLPRTCHLTPAEKTVQKMKALNLLCKNCKDPKPTAFVFSKDYSEGYCRRCVQYNKRKDSYPKKFRRQFNLI